ncbi:hypothetical protein [Roseibium album]|uniref:hypothetical protein n=1 Tax=Roseibium album TaxID=311410 RepID=UPI002493BED4|nr:hypothetical protein [Roseibium album]
MADLKKLIAFVEEKVSEMDAAIGPHPDWRDRDAHDAWQQRQGDAMDKLKEDLLEAGAKFNARPAVDFSIRLGGIRSTSTSGISGAVSNWLVAARKCIARDV